MSTAECGGEHEGKGEEWLTDTDRFERMQKQGRERVESQYSEGLQTLLFSQL